MRAPPDRVQKQSGTVGTDSRIHLGLPRAFIMEKIGREHFIILEYIVEQIIRRNWNIRARRPP